MKSFLLFALGAHVHSWLKSEESQIVCLCFGVRIKELTAFWISVEHGKLAIYRDLQCGFILDDDIRSHDVYSFNSAMS